MAVDATSIILQSRYATIRAFRLVRMREAATQNERLPGVSGQPLDVTAVCCRAQDFGLQPSLQ